MKKHLRITCLVCVLLLLCCGTALAASKKNATVLASNAQSNVQIASWLYGPTNLSGKVTGSKVKLTWNADSYGGEDGYAIYQCTRYDYTPSDPPLGWWWNCGADGMKWVPTKLLKKTTSTSCTIDLKKKGTYYLIAISYSGSPSSTISSHSAGVTVKVSSADRFSASFGTSAKTLTIGQKWKVNATVSVSKNKLGLVTVKSPNLSNSTLRYDFSKKKLTKAKLSNYKAFTIDTTKAPWNKPGTYKLRLYAEDNKGNGGTKVLAEMKVTIKKKNTDPEPASTTYRALLIGEEYFSDDICHRNAGDVRQMATMLGKVVGPDGAKYKVTQKFDLGYSGVQSAINSAFGSAKDGDVSLFFIATHGNSSGDGELALTDGRFLSFYTLASWLKNVKGKVIVILESCGAGSAIYDPEEQNNPEAAKANAEKEDAASKAFVSAAVRAFSSADPGIVVATDKSTGDMRDKKFYVLAASRHREYSWGTESGPYNYFTKWLVDGVGSSSSSPADANKNRRITLTELFNYIKSVGDGHAFYDGYSYYYQHVQRYPVGSSYELFRFN